MPTEGQAALMLLTLRAWEFGLHWLIRDRWDSKHPMPRRLSVVRPYRCYGDFLHAIRQLAVQCHADAGGIGQPVPFPHAAAWFAAVIREIVLEEIVRSITPLEHLADERRKKEKVTARRLEPWRRLKRYENPADQQTQPATWLLFEVAIALAERGDQWRKAHFRPFCTAAKAWVKATSGEGWGVPSVTEDGRPWGDQDGFAVWATLAGESLLEPLPAKGQNDPKGDRPDAEKPRKKEPQVAELLMAIAQEATYWSTPDEVAYADLEIDGVRQTHPIRKKSFRSWLVRELYRRHGKTVSSDTLAQVLSVLEAEATIAGETREIYLRVARGENGKIYFDLGRSDWKSVEIDAAGWRIVSDYPVRFRRSPCMGGLPLPNPDGTLEPLRELLGVEGDSWALISSWLLFSYFPARAYPVLAIHGQAGSAKTSKTALLKNLVDPGKAGLLKLKTDERELAIQANNRWLLAYDNVSSLSQDQSDNLCRLSTGFGFSARTLHENDEETLFEFTRPQILNGIVSVATAGDLLSRAVVVAAVYSRGRSPHIGRVYQAGRRGSGRYPGRVIYCLIGCDPESTQRAG